MKNLLIAASVFGVLPLLADDLLTLPGGSPIESFTADGEGTRYFSNSFDDGGSDFWERVTAQPPSWLANVGGFDGAMWACEDPITDVTAGIVTLATITNAGDFAARVITIDFADAKADGRFEAPDAFLIQVAFDGGIPSNANKGNPGQGSYTTIGRLLPSDVPGPFGQASLEQDLDNDGTVTDAAGPVVTNDLSTFTFPIPDGGGTDMSIRIRGEIDGGSEEIAFDNIRVTGVAATSELPMLDNIEGTATTFTEGGAAVQITNTLTVSDVDSSALTGATVSITSNFDGTEDVLLFANQNGISGSYDSGTGVLTLSGSASLGNYQTALRSVTYDNTDNADATMATRTVRFLVTDDQSNTSLPVSRGVDVDTALDPATPLPLAGYCESFETDGEGTRYGSNHAVVNPASDYFERFDTAAPPAGYFGGTIAGPGLDGTFAWVSEDTLGTTGGVGMVTLAPLTVTGFTALDVSFALEQARNGDIDQWENTDFVKVLYSMDGAPFDVIGAFYGDDSNGSNGRLREDANLNGVSSDSDGGLEVPDALTNYTFSIPITGNTLRVRIEVSTNGSEEIAFDNICIAGLMTTNDPPVVANIEGTTIAYAEGSPAVAITSAITVSDTDDIDLESAKVEFVGAFSQSQDALIFTDQNGITGSYNAVAGDLTLTGTSSLANYQAALRSVQYINNDAIDAAPGTRTVRFTVNDGDSGSNLDQTRDIDVSVTLDPPIPLPFAGYCESFETDGAGTRYASNHATDGGQDAFERFEATGLPTGYPTTISGDLDGAWLWVVEDTNNTTGGVGIIDLQTQIVTGYTDLEVSVALGNGRNGEDRFENDDFFQIGYSMDGGPFTIIGAFYGNNPGAGTAGRLVQDVDLNGSSSDGDGGTEVPTALTTYAFPIAATGDNLVVGVRVSTAGSEELAFDNICITGTDVAPPVADLADPANGASVESAVINAQGYIEVTFNDIGGIDDATVTDAGAEISLTGTAAGAVALNGAAVLQSGTTYRYSFTGAFELGVVSVNFLAGSFADLAGNLNGSETESFTVLNDPPVASPDTVERFPTQSIKIPVADLLINDSDPNGHTLSITAVTASGSGAIVTKSATRVFYNPNGVTTADTFTYTLEDSLGATSTGTVNVNIIDIDDIGGNGANLVSLEFPGDGTANLTFAGIPGRIYRWQKSNDLAPPVWIDCGSVTADALGRVIFNDPGPLPAQRFYRTVYP